MYELVYLDKVERLLKKLPFSVSQRIIDKLEIALEYPHNYFVRLVGIPYYKLRVGKYRVIADIHDDKLVILVLDIAPRKNVYKNL